MWLTTQHTTIIVDVSCVASGQSSTITGTYVGQYVMQGFLDLKLKPWLRNLMTRSIAIIPSLVVSAISGYSGPGNLITISSMILSFDLPFVLIPLVKFTGSKAGMGSHKNSITKWRKKRPRQTAGGGGIVFVNNSPAIKGGFQSASDPGVLQLAHGTCSPARLSN